MNKYIFDLGYTVRFDWKNFDCSQLTKVATQLETDDVSLEYITVSKQSETDFSCNDTPFFIAPLDDVYTPPTIFEDGEKYHYISAIIKNDVKYRFHNKTSKDKTYVKINLLDDSFEDVVTRLKEKISSPLHKDNYEFDKQDLIRIYNQLLKFPEYMNGRTGDTIGGYKNENYPFLLEYYGKERDQEFNVIENQDYNAVRQELNNHIKQFIEHYRLPVDDDDWYVQYMVVRDTNILGWHIDMMSKKTEGYSATKAVYNVQLSEELGPIEFRNYDSFYYRQGLIDSMREHRVDNTNYPTRLITRVGFKNHDYDTILSYLK